MKKLLALLLMIVTVWATETDMNDAKPKRRKVYRGDIETHNPYITTLDFSQDCALKDLTFLAHFSELSVLNLENTSITSIKLLIELPHLKRLNISCCPQIKDLKLLGKLVGLEKLFMYGVSYDEKIFNLKHLKTLVHLEELDISSSFITKIQPLAHLPNLHILNIQWCSGIEDYASLTLFQALTELKILTNDVDEKKIPNLPNVQINAIHANEVTHQIEM